MTSRPPEAPRRAGPIGLIVAMTQDRVIGLGGKIPWSYPGDLRRFKRLTLGSTVIMGRITWESIGQKPLPGRRNIVITSHPLAPVSRREPGAGRDAHAEWFSTIPAALSTCDGPVWFIGGARIYAEGMKHADLIDVTFVPDRIEDPAAVLFPPIAPEDWIEGPLLAHEDEPALARRVYTRKPRPGRTIPPPSSRGS